MKAKFYLMGWFTLLVFPAIGAGALWYLKDMDFAQIFQWNQIGNPMTLLGLEFGFLYGFFVLAISQFPSFQQLSNDQERFLKSLNLNWLDILFMAFCAGFGEEILFRAGIQTWLGPWLTSVLFIAVHGYFNFLNLKKNLLGLVLFPFIILIAFAYETFGLWFCVAAHFAYDLLMFMSASRKI